MLSPMRTSTGVRHSSRAHIPSQKAVHPKDNNKTKQRMLCFRTIPNRGWNIHKSIFKIWIPKWKFSKTIRTFRPLLPWIFVYFPVCIRYWLDIFPTFARWEFNWEYLVFKWGILVFALRPPDPGYLPHLCPGCRLQRMHPAIPHTPPMHSSPTPLSCPLTALRVEYLAVRLQFSQPVCRRTRGIFCHRFSNWIGWTPFHHPQPIFQSQILFHQKGRGQNYHHLYKMQAKYTQCSLPIFFNVPSIEPKPSIKNINISYSICQTVLATVPGLAVFGFFWGFFSLWFWGCWRL